MSIPMIPKGRLTKLDWGGNDKKTTNDMNLFFTNGADRMVRRSQDLMLCGGLFAGRSTERLH